MKTVTITTFRTFDPCYSDEKLRAIRGKKVRWSALDILALEDVPAKDRLWAVLRPELIEDAILNEFACRCAETALALVGNPDPRSVAAIAAKRAWVRGEIIDAELAAARAAARAAAWDAARAAASDAARAAAWAAARAAASDAARAAAWDAARAAAWDAARDEQVKMLVSMLQ